MDFINEYASEEDIEKYRLYEIWDKYEPFRKGEYYGGNRPSFTISRTRDTFLMLLKVGIREEGNHLTFLLWFKGQHILAGLKQEGGSSELNASPFYRVWHLLRLEVPETVSVSQAEILETLKSALRVYGYWGVQQQIPNTIVNFKF